MCDDSPAERRYWIRKMEQMRKEMELEDRERERQAAAPSVAPQKPAAGEPQPLPV
jgi:hypothetical protein